jgi:predicted dehydrogenase
MQKDKSSAIRAVILGGGMIAEIHRRSALAAGAQLVGAMDSSPERSRDLAQRWGTEPIGSLDEIDKFSPDVVHVCTPNVFHAEHARAALRAGAHVICEKPLAVTLDLAIELATLAEKSQRVGTVPFVYRFHPLVREIRARVAAGEFGPWQLLHGSYLQDWLLSSTATNWRVDPALGGESRAFADIGSHWCDLLEFVSGERIASVVASMATTAPGRPRDSGAGAAGASPASRQTEDACTVLFRTHAGVIGSVTVSQVSAGRKNRLWFEFDGERQSAVFDQENPETAWLGSAESATVLFRDPGRGATEQRRLSVLPAGHPQGYAQCFERFIDDTYAAVRGELRDGLPTFADGVRSARIVKAVVESARSGRWVDVE